MLSFFFNARCFSCLNAEDFIVKYWEMSRQRLIAWIAAFCMLSAAEFDSTYARPNPPADDAPRADSPLRDNWSESFHSNELSEKLTRRYAARDEHGDDSAEQRAPNIEWNDDDANDRQNGGAEGIEKAKRVEKDSKEKQLEDKNNKNKSKENSEGKLDQTLEDKPDKDGEKHHGVESDVGAQFDGSEETRAQDASGEKSDEKNEAEKKQTKDDEEEKQQSKIEKKLDDDKFMESSLNVNNEARDNENASDDEDMMIPKKPTDARGDESGGREKEGDLNKDDETFNQWGSHSKRSAKQNNLQSPKSDEEHKYSENEKSTEEKKENDKRTKEKESIQDLLKDDRSKEKSLEDKTEENKEIDNADKPDDQPGKTGNYSKELKSKGSEEKKNDKSEEKQDKRLGWEMDKLDAPVEKDNHKEDKKQPGLEKQEAPTSVEGMASAEQKEESIKNEAKNSAEDVAEHDAEDNHKEDKEPVSNPEKENEDSIAPPSTRFNVPLKGSDTSLQYPEQEYGSGKSADFTAITLDQENEKNKQQGANNDTNGDKNNNGTNGQQQEQQSEQQQQSKIIANYPFLAEATRQAKIDYMWLLRHPSITKAQLERRRSEWAEAQPENVKEAFQKWRWLNELSRYRARKRTEQQVEEMSSECKTLYKIIRALIEDQNISRREECVKIDAAIKEASESVRDEFSKLNIKLVAYCVRVVNRPASNVYGEWANFVNKPAPEAPKTSKPTKQVKLSTQKDQIRKGGRKKPTNEKHKAPASSSSSSSSSEDSSEEQDELEAFQDANALQEAEANGENGEAVGHLRRILREQRKRIAHKRALRAMRAQIKEKKKRHQRHADARNHLKRGGRPKRDKVVHVIHDPMPYFGPPPPAAGAFHPYGGMPLPPYGYAPPPPPAPIRLTIRNNRVYPAPQTTKKRGTNKKKNGKEESSSDSSSSSRSSSSSSSSSEEANEDEGEEEEENVDPVAPSAPPVAGAATPTLPSPKSPLGV